jgi:hypothetical protein
MALNLAGLAAYTEQNKLPLITKALFSAKSARLLSKRTGIKSSEALNLMDTDAVFQADACGWSPSGTTAFTQRNITVGKVRVQEALCPKDLEAYWTQTLLNAGSNTEEIPFEVAYTDYKTGKIAEQIETAIWQGDTATGNTNAATNKWDGFIKLINAASGTTVSGNTGAVTGITTSNAFAVVQAVYNQIPVQILDKQDLAIVMGWDTFRKLVANLTTLNLFHYAPVVDGAQGELILPGTNVKVYALNGLNSTNRIFAFQWGNMFMGTDLEGDFEEFKMFWAQEAMEVRYHMAFKCGVQFAYPSEIVNFILA